MGTEKKLLLGIKPQMLNNLILFSILFITFLVFSNSLNNRFLNWDDDKLIYENSYVRHFAQTGFKAFLSADILWRDPLTLISQAVVYKFFGNNPMPFRLINILLHLLNVVLVFHIVKLLSKHIYVASIVALLFAIHPFRIESVVWVSERKDVLYAVFYLLGLLSYIFYLKHDNKYKYLIFAFFLSIISFFSKTAAVSFPVMLVLIDYFNGRVFTKKVFLEKIPFFFIMIILGIIHIHPAFLAKYRPEVISLTDINEASNFFHYTSIDKIFLGSYSFIFYLVGSIAPVNQSLIHPFPIKLNLLPAIYYFSIIGLLVFSGVFTVLLKKFISFKKDLLFGFLFFFFSIALVLHVIPLGGVSVVCERYTYLAYFGIFFIIGQLSTYIFENKFKYSHKLKTFTILFFCFYFIFLFVSTWNRNKVWKDSITIFTDVINKDHNIPFAYNNRGNAKLDIKDYYGAIADHNRAIRLTPTDPDPWYNRGCVKLQLKNYKGAISDFSKSLSLSTKFTRAFINRGMAKSYIKDFQGAIEDFNEVLKYDSKNIYAYYNRGRVLLNIKKENEAFSDFTKVIELDPNDAMSYFYRATSTTDYSKAIKDYDKALILYPDFPEAYYNRGIAKKMIKNYYGALNDLNTAIEIKLQNIAESSINKANRLRMPVNEEALNFKITQNKAFAYYNLGRLNYYLGNYTAAEKDLSKSIKYNNKDWDAILFRGMAKSQLNNTNGAIADFSKVLELKNDKVDAYFERANTYFTMKKYDEALTDYNKAISLNPNAKLYSNRGNVKFQLKDYSGSVSDNDKAIVLDPQNSDIYFNRGISKYYLNKKTDACNDFSKSAELGNQKAKATLLKYCR